MCELGKVLVPLPTDACNLAITERIHNGLAVAVHVRSFDAPHWLGVNNAPGDYSARAIARMESLAPDEHYFIFFYQPAAARDRIPLPEDHITLVSHNQGDEDAYAALGLMTQCQLFIIANSAFRWWAWLAERAGKRVLALGFEMREGKMSWGFEGLLPEQRIKL